MREAGGETASSNDLSPNRAPGSALKPYREYVLSAKKSTVKKATHGTDDTINSTPTRNNKAINNVTPYPSAFVAASASAAFAGLHFAQSNLNQDDDSSVSTPRHPSSFLPSPFPSPLPSQFEVTPAATPLGLGSRLTPNKNYDLPLLQGKYKKAKRLLQMQLKENEVLRNMISDKDQKALNIESKFNTEQVLFESLNLEAQARATSAEGDKKVLLMRIEELERKAVPPSPLRSMMMEDGTVDDSQICELLRGTILELESSLKASEDRESLLKSDLDESRVIVDKLMREVERLKNGEDERLADDRLQEKKEEEDKEASEEDGRVIRADWESKMRALTEENVNMARKIEVSNQRSKEKEDLMTARINQVSRQGTSNNDLTFR